jgi:hypothetical protein
VEGVPLDTRPPIPLDLSLTETNEGVVREKFERDYQAFLKRDRKSKKRVQEKRGKARLYFQTQDLSQRL